MISINNNKTLNNKLPIAIISSLTGGLGHYCAHLAKPLSYYCNLKFITYPQIDLSGTVVKELTDSLIKTYIKWPRFDLDDNNVLSIVEIDNYLQKREINTINIHVGTTIKRKINYFTTLLLYLKRVKKRKIVFTLHDVLPFDEDFKLTKILKIFYPLADHYITGNQKEKDKVIKYFHIPPSKIDIIPHGIYNLFDRKIYDQITARSYLNLPLNKKILLFFGFLREYKGIEYLIQANAILVKNKKVPPFITYIVASIKYSSKQYIEKILKLIKKLNLSNQIIINFNYLDTGDIEAVFKASDIVVLPYIQASQSGVMMMSFGFKKPVIISEAIYDKIWVNKKAGLVTKIKDHNSLAEKITELLKNDEDVKKYGEFGYQYAMKNFNWEKIAKEYFLVFKKVNE